MPHATFVPFSVGFISVSNNHFTITCSLDIVAIGAAISTAVGAAIGAPDGTANGLTLIILMNSIFTIPNLESSSSANTCICIISITSMFTYVLSSLVQYVNH